MQHQQQQPLLVLQQHEEAAAFTSSGSVSPMGSIEQPTTPDASSLAAAPAAGCAAGLRALILPELEPSAVSTVPAEHQRSWAGLQFGSWGVQADTPAESGTVAAGTFREDVVLQEQLPLSRNVCCEHSSSSSNSEALQFGSVWSGEAGTDSNIADPEADAMQGVGPSGWLAPAVGGVVMQQQQQIPTGGSSTGAQQQPAWTVPQFGAFDDSMLDFQLSVGKV